MQDSKITPIDGTIYCHQDQKYVCVLILSDDELFLYPADVKPDES